MHNFTMPQPCLEVGAITSLARSEERELGAYEEQIVPNLADVQLLALTV